MRLLIIRVPEEVAERRRADLEAEALRRNRPIRQRAWELADWTILRTSAPAHLLSLQEALVLLRERWQMEMLSKLWKQYGRIDEWRTANPWRVLCELYAKLIGLLLQHWLIILFAQAGMNSAVWSSWRRWCAIPPVLSWKLWQASARFALSSKAGSARMRSGCQMNKREARIPTPPSFSSGARRIGPWALKLVRMEEKMLGPQNRRHE